MGGGEAWNDVETYARKIEIESNDYIDSNESNFLIQNPKLELLGSVPLLLLSLFFPITTRIATTTILHDYSREEN
jgi:hypothetical protein